MTSRDRLIGLGLVWVLYAVLVALLLEEWGPTIGATVPMIVFLSIITLAVSMFVTRAAPPAAASQEQGQDRGRARPAREEGRTVASPKAKRSDMALVDRLIDSMSDSELDALRQRLERGGSSLDADGELLDEDIDLDQLRRRSR